MMECSIQVVSTFAEIKFGNLETNCSLSCQNSNWTPIVKRFLSIRNYNQRDEKTSDSKKMRLVILVGLLVVTVIALVAALTLQIAIFRREEHRELCQSEECIKTGASCNFLFQQDRMCLA
jgi:hypothetical protein